MNGVIHFLQVFAGMMCLLGGTSGVGGALVGTFLGVAAGIVAGALINVLMILALPGIPRMYGSGSLTRWFCFSLPAGAFGSAAGTWLSTGIGGISGALLGTLVGGLVAALGTFFLQRVIPDWKKRDVPLKPSR